jgi:creatinine amidohydrolase
VGAPIATASYWILAEEAFAAILEDQRSILHACEGETSMMMAVRPELLDRSHLGEAFGPQAERAGSVLNQPMHRWRSFKELTPTGVFGDARRATPEKGERLLEAAVDALAGRLARGEPWA